MSASVLAPWTQRQLTRLLTQRGHAWLLQGPSGLGQDELAFALARAWLCEAPTPQGACGVCGSCHAIDVHTHADLMVLMPEALMLAREHPLPPKAQDELDKKTRKPSKEIRVDALRDVVEFAQRTNARGRGKVVVVYPAERMNAIAANTLLKTLEEPAGDLRFVLASEAAHQLLPTIKSRCQTHTLDWPTPAEALDWLQGQGVSAAEAATWLRAAGGRPQDALQLAQSDVSVKAWAQLPKALAQGDAATLAPFTPPQAIEVLQKLCHDLLARVCGGEPRFFDAQQLPSATPPLAVLTQWAKSLMQAARTAEHPYHPGLMLDALAAQARAVLLAR